MSSPHTSLSPEMHDVTQDAMRRFVDSQPILNMLSALSRAGHNHFNEQGSWEICLCALILTLEPGCTLQRVAEALPYSKEPMDEAELLNTIAHLGYVGCRAEAALEEVDDRLLPALFIPSEGEPCIVIGRNDEGTLLFYDPLSRMVSHVPSTIDEHGKVWFFQPYDETKQPISRFMRKGSGHSWFRALLTRFHGTFAQVMVAGFILNLIALAPPIFIMVVYDRVIAAHSLGTLPMLAVGAVLALVFEWKLRCIRSTGLSWLAGRLDNIVSNRIFSHLIGLSPALIERASVAAQIARIKTFESVRDFFSSSLFLSLLDAPFVLLAIAAIALIAGPLAFVPVAMVAVYGLLFWAARQRIKVLIRLAAKASSARQQFTIETFEKMHGIRSQGINNKWHEKFRHLSGREMMAHFNLGWVGMVAEACAHAITIMAAVLTIGVGVHMIWEHQLSTGALVACMMLVWRVLTPFYSLCTMIPRLEQLRNSIIQVNDLMELETEAEEARSFSRIPALKGSISFQHVSFRHTEEGDNIFSDLSFEAKPGELVALTGSSGSGKKIVLQLVQSLLRPHHGSIRIDDFDIRQLDAPHLRQQIAYAPKNPHLFQGTVIENLRFANLAVSEEDMQQALELAAAWDDIQLLPQGMHTVIGQHNAVHITPSLATRISLARAYLHPSSIMLIDELPNALLCGKVGDNLKQYLQRAHGKRTIILCSYREDYLQMADHIVWLRGLESPIFCDQSTVLSHLIDQHQEAAS